MADRRTRSSDQSRTTAARAAAIAEQLHHECRILLELFRNKENFTTEAEVAETRLVSVPPPSSQLDARDRLWRLHSALLQCRSLLERAVVKEDEELSDLVKGEYESQRKTVKERLSLLQINTAELVKNMDGTTVLTPGIDSAEIDRSTDLFEVKLWIYRVYKELDFWALTAITTLQALPSVTGKERAWTGRARSARSALR